MQNGDRYVCYNRKRGWCICELVNQKEWLIRSGFTSQREAQNTLNEMLLASWWKKAGAK